MSDQIPIGSPPAPPGRHAAAPGWYSDPADRRRERYWDGWQWSRNTRESVQPTAGYPPDWPLGPTGGPAGSAGHSRTAGHPAATGQPGMPGPAGPGATTRPGTAPEPYPGPGAADGSAWSGYRGYGLPPAPTTADGVPLAAWGARLLAAVIDWIAVLLVSQLAALPFSRPMYHQVAVVWRESMAAAARGVPSAPPTTAELVNAMSPTQQAMYVLIVCVVGFAYYALLWRHRSATLGQLVTGVRVVPVGRGLPDPADGGRRTPRLAWSSVLVRTVVWVLPAQLNAAFWLFTVLDGLWPLWNPRRQAIHDLVARTQVVRIR